jgi:hypothetical protein
MLEWVEGKGYWYGWREGDIGMDGGRGDVGIAGGRGNVDKGDIGDMKGVEERKYGVSER